MIALQKLGEALVNLPAAQLAEIPLDPLLLEAVDAARSYKSHEAKRRQLQYIGRLMREIDPEPIQFALEKIQSKGKQAKAQFHQVERWRDKLIEDGDKALQPFLEKFPNTDHTRLRQLVRNAQQEKTGADTQLFRYLKQIIDAV